MKYLMTPLPPKAWLDLLQREIILIYPAELGATDLALTEGTTGLQTTPSLT